MRGARGDPRPYLDRSFRKRQKTHYRLRAKGSLQALLERHLVRAGPPTNGERLKRRFGC